MKLIKKSINKILPYLIFSILITLPISTISLTLNTSMGTGTGTTLTTGTGTNIQLKNKSKNLNLNALNLQFAKAFLSTEDFQITKIYPKQQKINTESIFFDEKTSSIYETGKMQNVNIILKKNYPTNKVEKAVPLGNYNIKGFAKCGTNFYQFSGLQNKILRFTYPNLDFLTPINIDYYIKNGEGLAELSEDFLIASNGTDMIFVLDCKNDLNVIKSFSVRNLDDEPLLGIKEMVVVGEYVYLLRENDNRIFKISPATGKVVKFYNLGNLLNFELKTNSLTVNEINKGFANLSGIGYDKNRKGFLLTGRNWGHYYEVDLK